MIGYTAKILDTFEYSPGGWKGQRVGIFLVSPESEEQIGEYTRNYGEFYRTFYPFKKGEKDYALYSPHYTVTRVMELPSCRDIGGEEPHSEGFCPVDFFVPSYILKDINSRMAALRCLQKMSRMTRRCETQLTPESFRRGSITRSVLSLAVFGEMIARGR